jgi:hypothetical protein
MTTLTMHRALGHVRRVALVFAGLALVFAGSAPARARDSIHVAVPRQVKRKVTYNVTVTGFSSRQEKAYLFVDYHPCAATVPAERRQVQPIEEMPYTVKGAFTKVSGWKSPAALVDHACVFLVNPKTGKLLAKGAVNYRIR